MKLLLFHFYVAVFMFIYGLALFAPIPCLAVSLDPQLTEVIHSAYPNATIQRQHRETHGGQSVIEVDIVTLEGEELEVTLSEQGKILEVEKESSLPIIGGSLMIGAGGQGENAFYKGADDEIDVSPFLRYENGMFEVQAFEGVEVTITPFESNGYYISALGTYDMNEGYDSEDNTYLKGMDTVDDTINAGIRVGKKMGNWELSLQGLQEVTGEHNGQEVSLEIGRQIDLGTLTLWPSLSLSWLSSDKVDYYYGVASHEARSDRPLYSPDSSYEVELQLLFDQELYGNFSLIGYLELGLPGGEITDSPVVDEDYEFTAVLGLAYTF